MQMEVCCKIKEIKTRKIKDRQRRKVLKARATSNRGSSE